MPAPSTLNKSHSLNKLHTFLTASLLAVGVLFYVGSHNSKSLDVVVTTGNSLELAKGAVLHVVDGYVCNKHYKNTTITSDGKKLIYDNHNADIFSPTITRNSFPESKKETLTNYQIQPLEYIPIKIRE